MNAFFEHHKNSIRLHYRCFDRVCDLEVTIREFSFFWA